MCIVSLRYPTCNTHTPHFVLRPTPLYSVSTLSHKWYEFRNKLLNIKCVFRLSLQLLSETFFIPRRTEQEMVFMWSTLYSCPILMKLKFSPQFVEKYSYITFHENPSNGSWVVPCGRTDGRTDVTKLIVAFRNFAEAPNNKRTKQTPRIFQYSNKVHFHWHNHNRV